MVYLYSTIKMMHGPINIRSILHVYEIKTGKVSFTVDAESLYGYNLQVYTVKSDGARRSRSFKLPKIWSVICMEPEKVLLLIISLQAVN